MSKHHVRRWPCPNCGEPIPITAEVCPFCEQATQWNPAAERGSAEAFTLINRARRQSSEAESQPEDDDPAKRLDPHNTIGLGSGQSHIPRMMPREVEFMLDLSGKSIEVALWECEAWQAGGLDDIISLPADRWAIGCWDERAKRYGPHPAAGGFRLKEVTREHVIGLCNRQDRIYPGKILGEMGTVFSQPAAPSHTEAPPPLGAQQDPNHTAEPEELRRRSEEGKTSKAASDAEFERMCKNIDPFKAKVIAGSEGKELPRVRSADRGENHVPTEWMLSIEGEPMPVDIRYCEIWGDGRRLDLIKTPDGRFAFGQWREADRRYVVNPTNRYRLWDVAPRDVIAWCNVGGYIYPDCFMPNPHLAPKEKAASSPTTLPEGEKPSSEANGEPTGRPDLVTLDQAAAHVHKSKRALEYYKTKGKLPDPYTEGGGGKAALYDWRVLGPWLTKQFGIPQPEKFPRPRES